MPPTEAAGRKRFHQYIDVVADATGGTGRGGYPDLELRPWHDASDFPLAGYLEAHFAEIRDEVLALEPARFHRESERIERTGDWDVAFFYERGRRREEVCEACPVTTRGIETMPAMRTAGGLIYVSRMRPGTHIRPHRGPTNLRLRCHLGITVPDGDCALRVGGKRDSVWCSMTTSSTRPGITPDKTASSSSLISGTRDCQPPRFGCWRGCTATPTPTLAGFSGIGPPTRPR
jgi:hypothetical protein